MSQGSAGHGLVPQDSPPGSGLAAMILAAGAGLRFGSAKPLAKLAGRPLLLHAVDRALRCADAGVIVVSGAHHAAVLRCLGDAPVRAVFNARWQQGLASSIVAGLAELPATSAAVLLMLVDQPAIDERDLQRLKAAWQAAPRRIAAARYCGACGVPAIFPRHYWPRLAALRGDRGARALLAEVAEISPVAMARAALDVDTPEELARLEQGLADG